MPRSVPACSKHSAGIPAIMGMLTFIMVCLLTLASTSALAATWTGGGTDNNWSTAGNWLGGVVPGSGDVIEYDANSTARLNQTNDIVGLNNMMIDMDDNPSGSVTINGNEIGVADGARDAVSTSFGTSRELRINAPLRLTGTATVSVGGTVTIQISDVDTNGFNLYLDGGGWDVTCIGTISGSGNVTYDSWVQLSATPSYTGRSILENIAYVTGSGGLPSASALEMRGSSEYDPLNSTTVASLSDDGSGNSRVRIRSGRSFTTGGDDSSTSFSGQFTDTGTLIKTGTGTMTLSGNSTNSGAVQFNGGALVLSGTMASTSFALASGTTLRLGADERLPDALTLTIGAGGTFDLNDFAETIGNFSGSGILSLGNGTLTFGNASNTSFSGNVTSGLGATINKQGTGTFTLPAGTTIITGIAMLNLNGGTFVMDGNWGLAGVDVNNGATLAGSGMIGLGGAWVHAGGTIAPGNSPGRLAIEDGLALDAGSTMRIELNGTTPITEYDQVLVGSGWFLPGNLSLSLGYTPAVGDSYMIIENFGGLGAPFAGLPQGGVINAGGYAFQINYLAGDGNDVVLTCLGPVAGGDTPTPEPEPAPNTLPAPSVPQGSGPSPAGSLDGSQLSWPHVKGASYYRIYRADCPNCKRKEIGRVRENSFIDNTAEAGRPYYYWLRTENSDGLGPYSNWLAAWRYEQNPGRAGDFNGDGIMDLLWWDPATNQLSIWFMNGGQVVNVSEPGDGLEIAEWLLIALADFNGDGACDLLWWKPETGEVKVWYMDKAKAMAGGDGEWLIKTIVDLDAMTGHALIAYPGDVNGDGRADILWRDYSNGQVTVWLMGEDGKHQLSGPPTPADETITKGERPGLSGTLQWQVVGLSDANASGKADVIWKDARNNKLATWLMEGSNITKAIEENKGQETVWRAVGVGDLNMDKQADIVWRNEANGAVQAWLMLEGVFSEERAIEEGSGDATQWQVKAVGDFCAPGCDDVYCKHSESSAVRIKTLDGREFTPSAP